jgi:hypothetical protein
VHRSTQDRLASLNRQLEVGFARTEAVSPRQTLLRGYTITRNARGRIIAAARAGDRGVGHLRQPVAAGQSIHEDGSHKKDPKCSEQEQNPE